MVSINGTVIGDLRKRSVKDGHRIAKPELPKATTSCYYMGMQYTEVEIEANVLSGFEAKAAAIRAILKNGEGVYYLYDAGSKLDFANNGIWVCITGWEFDQQSDVAGIIKLSCVIASDHTDSTYTP